MADKHPYISANGGVIQAISQLRKSFPGIVSADTFKKLGIAPNNESYVINILRFTGVIDAEGKKTNEAAGVFSKHDDADFQVAFADLVRSAYSDLFELHGDAAWKLPSDKLISFFRNTDQTSSIVGQRQAGTFQALAALSGGTDSPTPKPNTSAKKLSTKPVKRVAKTAEPTLSGEPVKSSTEGGKLEKKDVGLTVRIEINLPVAPDQETYDRIFRSIKENLLDA